MNRKIKIASRGVTHKRIHQEIQDILHETVTTIGIRWTSATHRSSFVEVLEEFFEDQLEQGIIQQYKVICDQRNNPDGFANASEYVFEVQYRMPHCVSMTSIEFKIPADKR